MSEIRFTVRRTLRLEPDAADRLDRLAAESNMTLSAFVADLVMSLDAPRITLKKACETLEAARRAALGGSDARPRGAARRVK